MGYEDTALAFLDGAIDAKATGPGGPKKEKHSVVFVKVASTTIKDRLHSLCSLQDVSNVSKSSLCQAIQALSRNSSVIVPFWHS